ncbi:sigma-70 family RNA polymerase sigma factor [Pikeienuella sp. HZG-20]|uniref:sigma-70 family RNA polymerase sigma factor n=1 Tax=Paludibacillus litoralis TaxID=3133267 RepID=UPI0030EF3630
MSGAFRDELMATMPAVRGFARTFERDAARADDLVQETMVKAWASRERFKAGTNMKAWLFTILRNSYISQYRKKKREVEDIDGEMTAGLSERGRQEGHMAMLDLRAALAELPHNQREAVILVGAAGFSYDEAAEVIGVAAGTVKSRVSRARARLEELMSDVRPVEAPPPGAPLKTARRAS